MLRLTASLFVFLSLTAESFAQGAGAAGAGATTGADSVARQDMLPLRLVEDVTQVFNSRQTMRLRGDGRVGPDSTIPGDIAVLRGQLTIAGHVRGRVVAINGDVILEPSARVDRDIIVVGGTVGGRENGRVRRGIRTYRTQMMLAEDGDSIVADPRYSDEKAFWSRYEPDGDRNSARISVRGETYNRVEGLPVLVGPSVRLHGQQFRGTIEALGIIRTAERARWDSENIGHKITANVRTNSDYGVGIGGSLFDVVEPMETWQFTDHEVGLATFVLHRDFRDYYARHGGALRFTVFGGYARTLDISYGLERWRSRDVRSTWTVFRDSDAWRPNPEVHDGSVHVLSANLRMDTRNSETNPWSGWLVDAQVERGHGELRAPLQSSPAALEYSRMLLDLRRYNRVAPGGQLNVRFVYGARLGNDELPLQKRFSLGGPGSLPGFDFRRRHGGTDVGMCTVGGSELAAGAPALCERIALLQLEFRGDIHMDLFDSGDRDGDGDWREVGHHPGSQWVVFVDGGRGWLVGNPAGVDDGLTYPSTTLIPRLGTFRTDVGIGFDMGPVGVYVAKAISQSGIPANFFVRLGHRF